MILASSEDLLNSWELSPASICPLHSSDSETWFVVSIVFSVVSPSFITQAAGVPMILASSEDLLNSWELSPTSVCPLHSSDSETWSVVSIGFSVVSPSFITQAAGVPMILASSEDLLNSWELSPTSICPLHSSDSETWSVLSVGFSLVSPSVIMQAAGELMILASSEDLLKS
nr:hypothetical protein Itr_chr10CG08480 [Ipomoea trifida]